MGGVTGDSLIAQQHLWAVKMKSIEELIRDFVVRGRNRDAMMIRAELLRDVVDRALKEAMEKQDVKIQAETEAAS